MRLYQRLILTLGIVFLLASCATTRVDPNDASLSLVYGYLDMTDAPTPVNWVSVRQYGGPKPLYWGMHVKDGLFFHVGLPPGSYQVDTFGGTNRFLIFSGTPHEYNFGGQGRNESAIRIQSPGVHFMGAFRYKHNAGGFFKADTFNVERTSAPTERELLARVVAVMESDGDYAQYKRQIAQAKQRLAQLK